MDHLSAGELAERVSGSVEGDPSRRITGVAPVEQAGGGDLTFVVDERYAEELRGTGPAAVLVPEDLTVEVDGPVLIRVANPRAAFGEAIRLLYPEPEPDGRVAPSAVVQKGARLGEKVSVGPHAVVEADVEIGARTRLGPHAVVRSGARIGEACVIGSSVTILGSVRMGDRVRVQTGARLGTEGYGYVDEGNRLGTASYGSEDGGDAPERVPQIGRCLIGDEVEVGANCTVDRGAVGDTRIGARTKIDNLVHIGHNVHIGEDCMIVAQVGLAGSVELGERVQIAGQAGVAGHLTIGDGARIAGQAGVIGDVPAGATYSGYPARPHGQAMRASAALFRLPGLLRRLRAIEEKLGIEGGDR